MHQLVGVTVGTVECPREKILNASMEGAFDVVASELARAKISSSTFLSY